MDEPETRPSQAPNGLPGQLFRQRPWLLLLIGAGLFTLVALLVKWQSPVTAIDLNQPWLNTALPVPGENSQIRHSFIPKKDGFSEIELLVARYGTEDNNSLLDFVLQEASGQVIAAESWRPDLLDNQPYILRFPHQEDSAGQGYTLIIGGSSGNTFSVWGYDLDVADNSDVTMVGDDSAAEDLHFTTRYQLSSRMALAELGRLFGSNAGLILLSVLFMLMPGCLALLAGYRWTRTWDPAAWLGVVLATGVALWPLLWLWLTALGGSWSSWSLWLVFISGWMAVIGLTLWRTGWRAAWRLGSRRLTRTQPASLFRPFQKRHLWLLLILLAGLSVRLLAVRDQAFPLWVDSSRHALITAVMSESGQVITDYGSYLPVSRFPYHYGFHTLSSSLKLMTDMPLPRLLLVLGQTLNALVPLAVYSGAYLLTKRFRVAILAAFLVALPFLFPGYYATWGRMTQLTAMLILPVSLGLTWLIVRGASVWRKSWWLLAILASGLFLAHFRVFVYYLAGAVLVWLLSRGRNGRWLALAAGMSAVLSAPRIIQLLGDLKAPGTGGSVPGYNEFPIGYTNTGWERGFLILLGVLILFALAAALRSRRWAWLPLFLVAWSGIVALMLSGSRLGLPESSLLNLNSAYISFFLPLSLILAIVVDRVWRWIEYLRWPFLAIGWVGVGVLLAALTLFGIRQQVDILNTQTIIAHPPDVEGIAWLNDNLLDEATLAVNSWNWLGSTWTGNDGGAWITPLTGLRSTTPPADYIYDRMLAKEVNAFNIKVSQVEDWSEPIEVEWLQEQGVTHIFVGARGGFFDLSELARNPLLSEVFHDDGVFIFSLQ